MMARQKVKNPSRLEAGGFFDNAKNTANFTPLASRIKTAVKRLIVGLAVWELISPGLATWLIRRGGMTHE